MKPNDKNYTIFLGSLILSFFFLLLPIDALTGYFSSIGANLPLSVIWKLILFFCVSIYLLKYTKGQIIFFSIIQYVSIIILVSSFRNSDEVSKTLNHLFRFLLCIVIYVFINLLSSRLAIYDKLKKIISFNCIFLVINILLILFGIGLRNYVDQFSSKGFFYAGNEVSGLFILLSPISLYWFSIKNKVSSIKLFIVFLLITTATVLLGSKTAIVATLFINSFVIKLYLQKKDKLKYFYIIIGLLIIFALSFGIKIIVEWDLWQRWIFFYNKGGLNYVIFSGRDLYWIQEKNEILNGHWYDLIFGLGGDRTVEMDIFDTFLNYGILGLLIIYSFYFYIIYRVYLLSKIIEIAKVVLIIDIVFIIFSSVAGHMIYSGMAAPFVAIINMIPILHQKEKSYNKI